VKYLYNVHLFGFMTNIYRLSFSCVNVDEIVIKYGAGTITMEQQERPWDLMD